MTNGQIVDEDDALEKSLEFIDSTEDRVNRPVKPLETRFNTLEEALNVIGSCFYSDMTDYSLSDLLIYFSGAREGIMSFIRFCRHGSFRIC